MKGTNRFCERTGAPLSDDKLHPFDRPMPSIRAPDAGQWSLLTNGERISTFRALLRYWRRCYEATVDDPDGQLVSKAAVLLRDLKRAKDDADVWIWHALQERLDRVGVDVDWMHGYAELPCPHCESALRFEQDAFGAIQAYCASFCRGRDGVDVWPAVCERVRTIYNAAVEEAEAIETVRVLEAKSDR